MDLGEALPPCHRGRAHPGRGAGPFHLPLRTRNDPHADHAGILVGFHGHHLGHVYRAADRLPARTVACAQPWRDLRGYRILEFHCDGGCLRTLLSSHRHPSLGRADLHADYRGDWRPCRRLDALSAPRPYSTLFHLTPHPPVIPGRNPWH